MTEEPKQVMSEIKSADTNATSMTKRLLRLKEFLGKFNLLSICSACGGVLIFFYFLKIGFFPDFTLANLAATFAAAALSAAVIVIAISAFCLMPGAATRSLLANIPSVIEGPADAHVFPRAPWHPTHSAMEHPRFVASLTPIAVVSWAWVFADSLHRSYGANWQAALIAYWLMIAAAVGAILCFGHANRRKASVMCWSIFAGLLLFLAVLFALSESLPSTPTAKVAVTEAPAPATMNDHKSVPVDAGAASDYGLLIASTAGLLGAGLLMFVGIRSQREKKTVTRRPSPYRLRWIRYDCVKLFVAGAFIFLSLAILYLSVVWATQGTPDKSWYILAAGAILLAIANWATFVATTVKRAIAVLGGTACILFVAVPAWGGFPLFLPELTVRSLGLGSLLLSHVTIVGKHCPALEPYGAHCGGDSPIHLTNINLLSRIGSTMVLELPVAMTEDPKGFQKDMNGALFVLGSSSQKHLDNGCDENLLAHLKDSSEAAKSVFRAGIQCVRLVLPREDVLTYTLNGARTYTKGPSALTDTN
ncbi:hypothetical protein [Cupriavidus metallidurans]|uniref:hypothetical protein n=1 Tax=Cupriavidus metallidurans TaxID=119219 RepID=UPI00126846CC|nr:hypothetical protein [Cupriavidus metallidurans]QGS28982.1 hypothetical protein FOB83_08770 [Cupriavidus metallidurans]